MLSLKLKARVGATYRSIVNSTLKPLAPNFAQEGLKLWGLVVVARRALRREGTRRVVVARRALRGEGTRLVAAAGRRVRFRRAV